MRVYYQNFGVYSEKSVNFERSMINPDGSFVSVDFAKAVEPYLTSLNRRVRPTLQSELIEAATGGFQMFGLPGAAKSHVEHAGPPDDWFLFLARKDKKAPLEVCFVARILVKPLFDAKSLCNATWEANKKGTSFSIVLFLECRNHSRFTWTDLVSQFPSLQPFQGKQNVGNIGTHIYDKPDVDKLLRLVLGNSVSLDTKHGIQETRGLSSTPKDDSFEHCCEGAKQRVEVDRRERDPRIRNAAIRLAKGADRNEPLRCEVCTMSFQEEYGELGRGFIEAHHKDPLSNGKRQIELNDEDSVREYIALLCSNCHRMIHRGDKLLTVEELRKLIREAAGQNT